MTSLFIKGSSLKIFTELAMVHVFWLQFSNNTVWLRKKGKYFKQQLDEVSTEYPNSEWHPCIWDLKTPKTLLSDDQTDVANDKVVNS